MPDINYSFYYNPKHGLTQTYSGKYYSPGTLISSTFRLFSITALQCSPPNSPSSVHESGVSLSTINRDVLNV